MRPLGAGITMLLNSDIRSRMIAERCAQVALPGVYILARIFAEWYFIFNAAIRTIRRSMISAAIDITPILQKRFFHDSDSGKCVYFI